MTVLRLDHAVHDALTRWAGDDLRSTNAQIEFLLRRALAEAGRLPADAGQMRRPGRPPRSADPGSGAGSAVGTEAAGTAGATGAAGAAGAASQDAEPGETGLSPG